MKNQSVAHAVAPAKAFNIVLPQELVDKIDSIAKKEYLNRSELIREALKSYLNEASEGRKIHGHAAVARESGDFITALKFTDEAMAAYQKDKDKLGFAEVQADRFLTFNHLYQATGDRNYLILAKHAAESAVEIAEASGDKSALALPYFNLAKAQQELGEQKEAVESFKKALENLIKNPPAHHKVEERPAMVADFKNHLAAAEYKNGDKSALQRAEQAAEELEKNPDISDYNQHVWSSGAHMRIAKMLKKDNPEKAKKHLEEAKKIIDNDPRLTLRLAQWQKLAKDI